MSDRIITAARVEEDAQYEAGLRPRTLDTYIGQDRVRENLHVAIAAALKRGEPLDRISSTGRPVWANDAGLRDRERDGRDRACDVGSPAIEKPGGTVGIVTNLLRR